jgi:lysyl-tRNA synthetase class 2
MRVYSIARFRHLSPTPPFWLGGQFWRESADGFLVSPEARIEIRGDLSSFKDGDQIIVQVLSYTADVVEFDQNKIENRPENPQLTRSGPYATEFADFVRMVRRFFVQRAFTEVFTPTLVTCPGLEPHLEPFAVQVTKGREKKMAYLPTSPEIHLKKAMATGLTDIFEIKTCFRRGEFSRCHENEFLMLEWYRGFADLGAIVSDLRDLLQFVADKGFTDAKPALRMTTFASLFRKILQFDLHPATTAQDLHNLCHKFGVLTLDGDSFNDLFHRLVIEQLEPRFAKMGPLVVRNFPPSMAALAKLTKEGWADRFEFYWNGLEIANAFNEVIDPAEQIRRWRHEKDERMVLGTSEVPDDPALIQALRRGLPPTGGIALGVERLYMACRKIDEIRELRLFSSDDLFG